MLGLMEMQFEGREHCGLDDARNITRIAEQLLRDGCSVLYNRFIQPEIIASVFKNSQS